MVSLVFSLMRFTDFQCSIIIITKKTENSHMFPIKKDKSLYLKMTMMILLNLVYQTTHKVQRCNKRTYIQITYVQVLNRMRTNSNHKKKLPRFLFSTNCSTYLIVQYLCGYMAVRFSSRTLRLHFFSLSSPMFFDHDDDNDGSNKIPNIHTISHETSMHVMLYVFGWK